jgi:hypothetical protein
MLGSGEAVDGKHGNGETEMRKFKGRPVSHYIALTSVAGSGLSGESGTFRTLREALDWLNEREPHLRDAGYTTHILGGNCTVRKVVTGK